MAKDSKKDYSQYFDFSDAKVISQDEFSKKLEFVAVRLISRRNRTIVRRNKGARKISRFCMTLRFLMNSGPSERASIISYIPMDVR